MRAMLLRVYRVILRGQCYLEFAKYSYDKSSGNNSAFCTAILGNELSNNSAFHRVILRDTSSNNFAFHTEVLRDALSNNSVFRKAILLDWSNIYWSRSTVSSAVVCMPSDIESYCCSSTPNMSTRNTLSAQESSTTPVMGGVQASTNDINEASQSEDVTDNNEDEENNPYCRKKRKRTSPVWTDFKQITLPDGKMKAECIHCKHRLSITTSGCTSHLNRHSAGCVRRQMNTTGQKNISIITSISESETVSVV
ncbi:hypothetical protein ZIOFF_041939 [Zingiber officinale]|uniref:BED-type domain-containing protein n=1 Tax=Zingiber officinale TaxID=94328 RepID=A0A8J5GJH3_ZINOF|nr:hypothetical protein ZIOFF_041939 [Zingiber officinale]